MFGGVSWMMFQFVIVSLIQAGEEKNKKLACTYLFSCLGEQVILMARGVMLSVYRV